MNKKQLIQKVRTLNPLRSTSSWNLESKASLQTLFLEGQRLGVIRGDSE